MSDCNSCSITIPAGKDGKSIGFLLTSIAPGGTYPNGATQIDVGLDVDLDGIVDLITGTFIITNGEDGAPGANSTVQGPIGEKGWSPLFNVTDENELGVDYSRPGEAFLEIYGWTGGTGVAPTDVGFLSPTGLKPTPAWTGDATTSAYNIRGPIGTSGTIGTQDAYTVVQPFGTPDPGGGVPFAAFGTYWSGWGGAYPAMRFKKDQLGIVHLMGSCQIDITASGQALGDRILQLPVGYRPDLMITSIAINKSVNIWSGGSSRYTPHFYKTIEVDTTGIVRMIYFEDPDIDTIWGDPYMLNIKFTTIA